MSRVLTLTKTKNMKLKIIHWGGIFKLKRGSIWVNGKLLFAW